MDTRTRLENMTHTELVNHAMSLEKMNENTVYSIDTEDLSYALSTMLSVTESFIPEALVEKAQEFMRGRFTIDEESTQIADFLDCQEANWKTDLGDYSGRVDNDGDVLIYFTETPEEDEEADIVLSGDEQTAEFFQHVFGDGWMVMIEASPFFQFKREQLEGYGY